MQTQDDDRLAEDLAERWKSIGAAGKGLSLQKIYSGARRAAQGDWNMAAVDNAKLVALYDRAAKLLGLQIPNQSGR